jgi:hypothetical protein
VDLFFRLNVVSINMPPLRDRRDEIPMLSEYFLKKYSMQYNKPHVALSPEAMQLFVEYDWPRRDAPDGEAAAPAARSRPAPAVLSDDERHALYDHTVGTTAALIGWFTCAMFASVAYSWTFYYVLALIVAARELAHHRLAAARALTASRVKTISVPAALVPRRTVSGMA